MVGVALVKGPQEGFVDLVLASALGRGCGCKSVPYGAPRILVVLDQALAVQFTNLNRGRVGPETIEAIYALM